MTGITASSNFPTVNAIQPVHGGGPLIPSWGGPFDGFVVKVNAVGSALVYSTYLGGSGSDNALGIVADGTGNVYVTGGTGSTDVPPTVSPIQASLDGTNDAYIVQLNAAGSAIDFGTYLGGAGVDYGIGIGLDSVGSIYLTGGTDSPDFPTQNPIQAALSGSRDAFIAKISFNQAPKADAGPDKEVVVGDTAALDGSGSSDPDGDPITYSWSIISAPLGSTAALSDTSVVSPTLAPDLAGVYVVELVVNDGTADSSPDSVTVTASTPAGATSDLAEALGSLEIARGTKNALIAKLNAAIDSLERGQEQAAVNQLNAFINQIRAQRGKKIGVSDADALIAEAQRIIAAIEAG